MRSRSPLRRPWCELCAISVHWPCPFDHSDFTGVPLPAPPVCRIPPTSAFVEAGPRPARLPHTNSPLPVCGEAPCACGPGCAQPGTRPCGPPALAAKSAPTLPMCPVWTLGEGWGEAGCLGEAARPKSSTFRRGRHSSPHPRGEACGPGCAQPGTRPCAPRPSLPNPP